MLGRSDDSEIQELHDEITRLRRQLANFPARFPVGGGGSFSATGPRYSIIQIIDDFNTIGADDARFKIPTT